MTRFRQVTSPASGLLRSLILDSVLFGNRLKSDRLLAPISTGEQRIAAYYTLASAGLLLADLPPAIAKKLPRYPSVPAVRMGRLAVDRGFKGQGLGSALLGDALERAARSEIAAYALLTGGARRGFAWLGYKVKVIFGTPDTSCGWLPNCAHSW